MLCYFWVKKMKDLKKQYEELTSKRNELIARINILVDNEAVKEYVTLRSENDQLVKRQKDLYEQIKIEEYSTCRHIRIRTLHEYDSWEGRSYDYYGCIKCGLDQRVLHENFHNAYFMTLNQQIMREFFKNHGSYIGGITSNVMCDLELARAIYVKIKEAHPNIDDITARKYFEIALDHIRNIKVSDERKASRAKRLSLNPNFDKWSMNSGRKHL